MTKTEQAVDCRDCGYRGTVTDFDSSWPDPILDITYNESSCPECDSDNIMFQLFDRQVT